MTAGSSQIRGIDAITQPPVVEIDTEATAAYVRLRAGKVAQTKRFESGERLIMLDLDSEGQVIGIEVVGQQEFSIRELLKSLPVNVSDAVLNQTRYVTADLQPA
ncbi:MAG: DUF2283 domain-containing protein [Verrucomicrobiota bacterium]|nr:DUF2283 domain-containing protein [Verrucomicrobiota bacterium]